MKVGGTIFMWDDTQCERVIYFERSEDLRPNQLDSNCSLCWCQAAWLLFCDR